MSLAWHRESAENVAWHHQSDNLGLGLAIPLNLATHLELIELGSTENLLWQI
jgi:hypothetical protein